MRAAARYASVNITKPRVPHHMTTRKPASSWLSVMLGASVVAHAVVFESVLLRTLPEPASSFVSLKIAITPEETSGDSA
eukprot:6127020-Prymnesium_polylepis.1